MYLMKESKESIFKGKVLSLINKEKAGINIILDNFSLIKIKRKHR